MQQFSNRRLRLIASLFTIAFNVLIGLFGLAGLLESFGTPPQTAKAAAFIFYVKPVANDTGNCLSWATACNLTEALEQASAGNEIWVAKGIYRPTTYAYDRNATFQLKNGVGIYGGFSGSETKREQRNFTSNISVLSGDIDANDITDSFGVVLTTTHISGTNSYRIVVSQYVTNTAVLDGFTITGAQNQYNGDGGGLYNQGGQPTIANVIFSGNFSTQDGGGMYSYYNSAPILTNVTFRHNFAGSRGGGFYNQNGSNPILTNVIFDGNAADNYGGGMYVQDNSLPFLNNVSFQNNETQGDGGGLYIQNSTISLDKSTFNTNIAAQDGGGMYVAYNNYGRTIWITDTAFISNGALGSGGGLYNTPAATTLTHVRFISNSATTNGGGLFNSGSDLTANHITFQGNEASGAGGGMYQQANSLTLINGTFHKNAAPLGGGVSNRNSYSTSTWSNVTFSDNTASESGGAIYNYSSNTVFSSTIFIRNAATEKGGAVYNDYNSAPTFINTVFIDNTAVNGGGIYNYSSGGTTLTNCSLNGNIAINGGAIYNQYNQIIVTNSIFWGNQASNGPQIYNGGSIYYSLIEGGCPSGSSCDAHLVANDPGFVDAENNNLRLKANSPAIDAGDNTASALSGITRDLGGAPRFTDDHSIPDTGNGTAPIVDLGAYEYAPYQTTTTSLSASPNPSHRGQPVTFSARVQAGAGVPTGNVTFYNGTTQLGTSNLNASGAASLVTSALPIGTHNITARYNGAGNFLASTSNAVAQKVTPNNIYLPIASRNYMPYFEGPNEREPNNDYQHANGPLRLGQTYLAHPNDSKDYFSFYLAKPSTIMLEMTGHTGEGVQMLLYYQAPVANGEVRRIYAPPYTTAYNGAAGWYYIYIYTANKFDNTSNYTLRISVPATSASSPAGESITP